LLFWLWRAVSPEMRTVSWAMLPKASETCRADSACCDVALLTCVEPSRMLFIACRIKRLPSLCFLAAAEIWAN